MESVETKIRYVPEDRIKRLAHSYTVEPHTTFNVQYVHRMMLEDMAKEIAMKLYEFQKISETKLDDGTIQYHSYIDVIVPPTPEKVTNAEPIQPPQ